MARESRRCWTSALEAPVTLLDAAGFHFGHATPSDGCETCGCPMGEHLAAMPGDTTVGNFVDRTGWVECESCDASCATWAVVPQPW